jgi:hypothetical protein
MSTLPSNELLCSELSRLAVHYGGSVGDTLREAAMRLEAAGTSILVKNGYCTDCGGINEHFEHCLTRRGAPETLEDPVGYGEWFKDLGQSRLHSVRQDEPGHSTTTGFSIEDLYQAFKARLIAETRSSQKANEGQT